MEPERKTKLLSEKIPWIKDGNDFQSVGRSRWVTLIPHITSGIYGLVTFLGICLRCFKCTYKNTKCEPDRCTYQGWHGCCNKAEVDVIYKYITPYLKKINQKELWGTVLKWKICWGRGCLTFSPEAVSPPPPYTKQHSFGFSYCHGKDVSLWEERGVSVWEEREPEGDSISPPFCWSTFKRGVLQKRYPWQCFTSHVDHCQLYTR